MRITDYITGTVIQGLGNGRKFGFPTANVQPDAPVSIEKGAYAAWVRYDGKRHKGMLYVGTRPTLNLHELTYEIHVIDASPRLYGKQISFKPVYKIAEEKKFRSQKELINALIDYKQSAKVLLTPAWSIHLNPTLFHINEIMTIIEQAKRRMKKHGLDQWQDGYPDEATIRNDKRKHQGHYFLKWHEPAAYAAIVFDKDPYYERLTDSGLATVSPTLPYTVSPSPTISSVSTWPDTSFGSRSGKPVPKACAGSALTPTTTTSRCATSSATTGSPSAEWYKCATGNGWRMRREWRRLVKS